MKDKYVNGTYKLTGNTGSKRFMAPEVAAKQHYGLPVDGKLRERTIRVECLENV
jgi:hypothetical protein